MAEILIKAVDAMHPDPVKDQRGCYKRGDVVNIMPDDHEWGNEECLPTFLVIKIPGLLVEDARQYIQSRTVTKGLDENNKPIIETMTRRRYKFDIDKWMSRAEQDEIQASNWLVKQFGVDKIEEKV